MTLVMLKCHSVRHLVSSLWSNQLTLVGILTKHNPRSVRYPRFRPWVRERWDDNIKIDLREILWEGVG
jgi:hypothetical protein